ncbi:Hypothetical_protein [Hexamita inflata]|uniref:Hypothetical_protein n=1 Tax=Hexamita inflata TaxID=28002 RepID=A0AA86R7B1_9EUKA|nr:Hypothetical protein HINF_LOCUS57628 [Hexamita inflata]
MQPACKHQSIACMASHSFLDRSMRSWLATLYFDFTQSVAKCVTNSQTARQKRSQNSSSLTRHSNTPIPELLLSAEPKRLVRVRWRLCQNKCACHDIGPRPADMS